MPVLTIVLCWMVCISSPQAWAQSASPSAPAESEPDPEPAWALESGASFSLFPNGDPYPAYVADPHRPTNAFMFPFYSLSEIPGVARRRTRLSAGGRFGLARFVTAAPNRRSWQVSFDGGLDAMFDSQKSDQAIGWDGNYGLTVSTASRGPWTFKAAWLHVSAHVGDEYEDNANRRRIEYTREEVALGVGFRLTPRCRVYGEAAHSFMLLSESQAPWRVQQGFEYESVPTILKGRFSWYGSVDLQSMQERGWRIDRAFQGGIVTHPGGHSYRIMVEYYKGRPTVSEFFKYSEVSLTWGLRIDL